MYKKHANVCKIYVDKESTDYMITRSEALTALDDMFRQAGDVSGMTLDEINAEIDDVRAVRNDDFTKD